MSNYTITEDLLFKNFIRSKPNISQATKTHYKAALTKFYKAVQTPLDEIITNCKSQQDRVIEKTISQSNDTVEKQIITFDVNSPESYINIYLNTFIDYCKETNIKTNSINNYLTQIQAVLSFYGIKLPDIEKFDRTPSDWNLLSIEDIKFIINDCSLMYAGLIKFLIDTGMRLSDALNLTWGDFMEATSEYHNCVTLTEFAEKAPQDMLGTWQFTPSKTKRFGLECITFNGPESSNFIMQNLRRLIFEYIPNKNKKEGLTLVLTKEDALFGSQKAYSKRKLTQDSVSDTFYNKNKKLRKHHISLIDDKISKGELSIEDREKEINKIPKFHAHACRKFFSSMIAKNCGNLRICAILEGHTPPIRTDSSYIDIHIEDIKEAYLSAIPDLSLENTETKVYTSEVRREMEAKMEALGKENEALKQKYDKKEVEVNQMNERLSSIEKMLFDIDQTPRSREEILKRISRG